MQHLMPVAYHVPVMLSESLDGLIINPDGIYIDLTFGGGGHARGILDRLKGGKLYAFDQDPDAKVNAAQFEDDNRFQFIDSNFRYFRKYLRMYGVSKVDGILADLGVSSHQFDAPERGFSTRYNSLLDMRMSKEGEKTAGNILAKYTETELQNIFSSYGEIRNSRTLARTIISARANTPITTVEQLNDICQTVAPQKKINKYLAQVYQSLRIEVNEEMDVLEEMLSESFKALSTGGRMVMIAYHSLEDRLVKNMVNYGNAKGVAKKDFYGNLLRPLQPVNRKPMVPSEEELKDNPRSRSAKLRIAERIEDND
jgi:16S rRNA (cytosine1402-N4)-methyltransferase